MADGGMCKYKTDGRNIGSVDPGNEFAQSDVSSFASEMVYGRVGER